jgi:L-ribulokinase
LHPKLTKVITEKMNAPVASIGSRAGFLSERASRDTGLCKHTAVAVAHTDACVVPAAIGMNRVGQMVMSVGTSTCHLLLGEGEKLVPGICGVVQNGTLPGIRLYEAGQASVGDIFSWFVQNYVNSDLMAEAYSNGTDIYQLLEVKAGKLSPGESGLVALDWFNGNRSILVDIDLSGMILGLNIHTSPEEIYRALIEGTAFGTKKIIETFESNGVPVLELFACGGIAVKSPLAMQIYADVCNREIHVSHLTQASACASAIYGAGVADVSLGGYPTLAEAVSDMANREITTYYPISENTITYNVLYSIYDEMHDLFGGSSNAMKTLKRMRKSKGDS